MNHLSKITHVLICFCPMIACLASGHVNYARAELRFGTPVNLGEAINSPGNEKGSWVSPDGLRIVFSRRLNPGNQPEPIDLCEAIRSSRDEEFPVGTKLEGVNIARINGQPSLTADGLRMVFVTDRSDLYETTRPSLDGLWSTPTLLSFSSQLNMGGPNYFNDGLSLALRVRHETGDRDIYLSSRPDYYAPWSAPEPISERINTSAWHELSPFISNDGKLLIFTSNRDGGFGEMDIYHSTLSDSGEWSVPVNFGAVINTSGYEHGPFLSYDGEEFYFRSDGFRETDIFGFDLYVATIVPEPAAGDFDEDGDIDGNDFLVWQRGESPNPLSPLNLADWEANFGIAAPLSATSTIVPEPATLVFVVIGGICIQVGYHRRHRECWHVC